MKSKNPLFAALFALPLFFCSCSNDPVKIVVDKQAADSVNSKIVIDGKITLNFTGDSTASVMLDEGTHFVQVNDSAKQEFMVDERGGILNLDKQEYVVYEIKYSSEQGNGFDLSNFSYKSCIVVDSFVIIPKTYATPTADSILRKSLTSLLEKEKTTNTANNEYQGGVNGLAKVGKGKLFIPKFWDYSMNEEIPKSIKITTSKYAPKGGSTTRSSILRARHFLYAVLLSGGDEYVCKSIQSIRNGEEDKVKTKEKESKQMKFEE